MYEKVRLLGRWAATLVMDFILVSLSVSYTFFGFITLVLLQIAIVLFILRRHVSLYFSNQPPS